MPERPSSFLAGGAGVVDVRAARLRADGWRVQEGFALPAEPWDQTGRRLVCHGVVEGKGDVAAAVLAAVRGAVVLAVTRAPAALVDRLAADLARLGPVEVVAPGSRGPEPTEALDDDQRALLALLGEGHTTAEAARVRHLSTRSAERRLAAARAALGVRSTAEAVARLLVGPGAGPDSEVSP